MDDVNSTLDKLNLTYYSFKDNDGERENHAVSLKHVDTKSFNQRAVDSIYTDGNLALTLRVLPNTDTFVFYDYQGTKTELHLYVGDVHRLLNHDYLYQKPSYDNRYGENKLTGLACYLDLTQGSAVVSKLHQYQTLTQVYGGGGASTLYHLERETADSYIKGNNTLCIPLHADEQMQQSGFVLLSASKLFRDNTNLDNYMRYFHHGVTNNNVWCSFFSTPAGTYCKLPYSIEPFTRDGYDYSLQHSSRKDMMVWLRDTGERFFENFIANAIYQAYLYQERQDGLFLTLFTSTWLKKDTGITAPYIDSRLNENFIALLDDFKIYNSWFDTLNPLKAYADFWVGLYQQEKLYRLGDNPPDGIFFADYEQPGNNTLSHTSLNHQCGIALALIKAHTTFGEQLYFDMFLGIVKAIEATGDRWLNPDTGDLYYGIKYNDQGRLHFFDTDYVYVTLYDLLALQLVCVGIDELGYSQAIEKLVRSKVNYLKTTPYDLFSDNDKTPSGEPINLKGLTQKLYQQVNRHKSSQRSSDMLSTNLKTVTINNSISLSGYENEYVFSKIQDTLNFYEHDILTKWFPDSAKVIYDIGANMGNHSVYFATTAKQGQVYAFEPIPDNFNLLTKNTLDNQLNTRIHRHNIAVGDTPGIVSLSVEKEGNLGTASVQSDNQGDYSAEVVTIDSLNLPTPDFIKIDVEGFELHVLQGMKQTLRELNACYVWIEVDTTNTIQVYELMSDCGFVIVDLDITANNNILWSKEAEKAIKPERLLLLLTEERDKREYFWTFTKYKSRFEYEQQKAIDLKNRLGKEASKYVYEQQNLLERVAHFEELAKKRASQFSFEQNKAQELQQRINQLQKRVDMFENSRMITAFRFVAWRVPTVIKRRLRVELNKLGKKMYVKLMPYPRLRLLASRINGKLKIYKNPQQITAVQPSSLSTTLTEAPIKQPQDMNVAVILDEFSYNSFKHEFNAHVLTPTNWREIFENHDIDLFFCESAWSGTDSQERPWKGKIYASTNFAKENRADLLDILAHCKKHGIPTAFWNKEDPTHYSDRVHDFVKTAILFDHVFTTADECVERYEKEYGHKNVHTLMFATQPKMFPPVIDNDHERSDDIVFAGSWYAQHPQRCVEMEQILDAIVASPYRLKIYDRHHGTTDTNHNWPEKYQSYIHPPIPHEQMHKIYTESKFALNINTVVDSDTMFARRVFELMGSNTLVISNYSVGMEELFGDIVVFIQDGVLPPLEDHEAKRKKALETVLRFHTYEKRFAQVVTNMG